MAPTEQVEQGTFVPGTYNREILWRRHANDGSEDDDDDDDNKEHVNKPSLQPQKLQLELGKSPMFRQPPLAADPLEQMPPPAELSPPPSLTRPSQPASAISPNLSTASNAPLHNVPSANWANETGVVPEKLPEGVHDDEVIPANLQLPKITLPDTPPSTGQNSLDPSKSDVPGTPKKEISPNMINSSSIISTNPLVNQTTLNPVSGLAAVAQSAQLPSSQHTHNDHGVLSPTAEHILVALGAIGAFIIFVALLFFIVGMRGKKGFFTLYGRNEFSRGQQGAYYEFDQGRSMKMSEQSPRYSNSQGFLTSMKLDEKNDSVFNSSRISRGPESIQGAPQYQNQGLERSRSFTNISNFKSSYQAEAIINPQYYSNLPQLPAYESNGTLNTATTPNYQNPGTLASYLSLTSSMYDPDQNRDARLSYVSSISSGFGDGLRFPAPTVAATVDGRPLQRNFERPPPSVSKTRASWLKSSARESMYSTSSIDTAPRFRTVKSWVKHQNDRLDLKSPTDPDSPVQTMPNAYRSYPPITSTDVNMQGKDLPISYHQDSASAQNPPRNLG